MTVSIAEIGHNKPPFILTTERIQDLYDEAKNWLDGDPLTTKDQHDALVDLVKQIRKAKTEADNARKDEAKPFDEGKAEIQDRYNPFIQPKRGLVDQAIEVANQALAPYLAEQLRLKREAEDKARKEADEKERLAREALQSSQGDLEAREKAERLVEDAKKAEATSKNIAATNIAKGARTVWDVEITDVKEAGRIAWNAEPDRFHELILQIGKEMCRAGHRDVPGFSMTERKVI